MLQRPQTLYLLGGFFLSLLLLTGPLARFTLDGSTYLLTHSGLIDGEGEKLDLFTWPMTVLFLAVCILAFLNIFLYRNRIRQMRICIFLILLGAGMIAMIFYYIWVAKNQLGEASVLHQWRIVLPPIIAILLYFAFRRIRRDELMVKAYDRIR
ncbi:MAG: DUF4293 domain-containing protein [Bacteroidota bacterium]